MAGRVNTKFVFILSSVLIVLVLGFTALMIRSSRDAQSLVARAEQYQAEGEMELAVETFKRAVGRSKSDTRIIQKYIDALKQMPADDQVEARNTLMLVRNYTRNLCQIDPDSQAFFQAYIDLIEHYIDRLGQGGTAGLSQAIYELCQTRLENNPQDETARRYRGAHGYPRLTVDTPSEEVQQIGDDLQWAHEQFPEDVKVTYTLARWKLLEAGRQARPGGNPALVDGLRDQAKALTQAAQQADPTNPMRKLEHFQIISTTDFDPEAEDRYAMIKPNLDELESMLLADPQPETAVLIVAQYLRSVYFAQLIDEDLDPIAKASVKNNQGTRRGIELLTAAVEAHPDAMTIHRVLGMELKRVGEFELARDHIEQVRKLSTRGEYVQALRNYNLRLSASIEGADLTMILATKQVEDPDRERMFTQAGEILDEVSVAGLGDTPRVLMLKGKLALIQNRVREGLVSIDKAAELYPAFSQDKAEALLLSAQARSQQGDWGAAAERYEQLLAVNPQLISIRISLASIYLRGQQMEKAHEHLDYVLTEDPHNEQGLIIQAALLAQEDDLDQAIKIYQQLDLSGRPDLGLGLAKLLILSDRKTPALQLLRGYFDDDPTNIQVLSMMLDLADTDERKRSLIQASRDGGADPEVLDLLTQQLDPSRVIDQAQAIQDVLNREEDPFLRAIGGARLYTRAGEAEKAREYLAEAAKLKPDHKAVVDLQFDFAMKDKDLELAQKLADRAAELNLDEASGRFYLAQIYAVREDYTQAISTLREGLEQIPINSSGWSLLGDMLTADNNFTEAVNAYETALEQRPNDLRAMRGLAALRDRQGRHEEALRMLKSGYDQYPSNFRLRDLYLAYEGRYGDKQAALKMRRAGAQKEPDNTDNLRALALLLAELEQPDEALQTIQKLIETQGASPVNTITLARVHQIAGDAQRGEQVIRQYIQDQGSQATLIDHIMLARYLLQIGDFPNALAAYEQAAELQSEQREVTRELANLYFSRGAFDRAEPLYDELHAQFPDDDRLGLRLADSLVRTGQFQEASQVLSSLKKPSATADALRALIAQEGGDFEEAMRLVSNAIEAEPGKAVLYFERAVILTRAGDNKTDAIQDLNTSLSLDPGHLLSRRLLIGLLLEEGQRREAARELNTAVIRHPDFAEGRLKLIQMRVQDADLSAARALAQDGVDLAPKDPTWHSVLAGLAIQTEDFQDAIKSYQTVMELAPTPANLMSLASFQLKHGRAGDALTLLRDHAEMVNQLPRLQTVMGRALLATGQSEQGHQVFARSIERCTSLTQLLAVASLIREDYSLEQTVSLFEGLAQPPSSAWVGLVLAQLHLEADLSDEAVSRLSSVDAMISPQDPQARQVFDQIMSLSLHQAGRHEEALVVYQRILLAQPDNTSILNNMAYMLAEDLGRPDEALPLAERAVEIEPQNAQILDTLGWVQFKVGQSEKAQATLKNSIALEPLSANHMHMAEVLISQGYKTEAGRYLKTAIDLAEQNNETDMLKRARELLESIDQLTEASVSP